MSVVLIRHGETEWNEQGLYQGQMDSPLTAAGVRGAELMGRRLARMGGCRRLLASDLGRTVATAEAIGAAVGLPVETDARLRERNLGVFQGLKRDAIQEQFPDEYAAYRSGDADYAVPEGESMRQVHERMVACLEEWRDERGLVVVSHGGALGALFKHVLGVAMTGWRRFAMPNTAYNCISYGVEGWRVDTLGDVSHLEGAEGADEGTD